MMYSKITLACDEVKTPSEVNIFLDFNASWKEVKTAQDAACAQGKSLKIIPDWPAREEYSKHAQKLTQTQIIYDNCKIDSCFKEKEQEMLGLQAKMKEIGNISLSEEELKKELTQLKTNYPETDIGRLIISGHDGGGNFSGYNGELSREKIYKVFDQFPDQRSSIKSLYLLGCYTGTTQELALWNHIFPNALFVNGYEGQAPYNFRQKGLDYLRSSLEREEDIMSSHSKEELVAHLSQIQHIQTSFTGLRIRCPGILNDQGEGLELNAFGLPTDKGDFIRDDPAAGCDSISFEKSHALFFQYYSGELEIPTDTGSSSPVRSLYNFASSNAHCMEYQKEFSIPKSVAFGLNFYHSLKKNAVRSSDIYHTSLVDFTEMKMDNLYGQYLESLQDNDQEKEDSLKAHELFESLLKQHGLNDPNLNKGDLWQIVDKIEVDFKEPVSDEDKHKKILADALKVTLWNSRGDTLNSSDILETLKPVMSEKVKTREEFDVEYAGTVAHLNDLNQKLVDLIPHSQTRLMNADEENNKLLSDASRAELMADFHIRKKEASDIYAANYNFMISKFLNRDNDPFMDLLLKKSDEMKRKAMQGIDYYQSGVVDLSCVPFAWHDVLDDDDSNLGVGNPCALAQM